MKVPVYERRLGIQPMNIPNAPTLQPISDNGEGTGKAMQDMFTRLQKINDDMEDARTLELFTKFKQDSQDYHEHPDKGIYRTRLGFEARGVYKDADQWMRQKGEEYVQQLPSERAKGAFRKMAKEYIIQRGEQNSKFEADQKRQYIDQSTEATIKNAIMLAGKYWDKPEHIQQARAEIYPALELRLRGAGREAFKNALAEVEDKIGSIRIAQALARHPLQALEMLRNPDVHLKPDTRAKLQLTMEQHAEVYELQAIAEEYAKHYTPETAVEAREKLIKYYGAEKGEKAFVALQRTWAVAQGQETTIKKNERERQEKNEDLLRIQIGDPNRPNPTDEQLTRSVEAGEISAQFYLQAMRANESDREKAERERKRKEKNELWARVSNNDFPTLEELQRGVEAGEIDPSDADYAIRRKEEHKKEIYEQNETAILDKILSGTASTAEIEQARKDDKIRAQFARSVRDYLEAAQEKDERKRQERIESAISLIIENGGRVSREQINLLQQRGLIRPAFASSVRTGYDTEAAKTERERRKQEIKLRAQESARGIMEEFGDDFAGARKAVNDIPASEYADAVRSEVEHLIQARKTHAQQQQQSTKDTQETAYRKYYTDAYEGKINRDEVKKLWDDKVISEAQRDNLYQLINARERNDTQQLKKLADEQGFITAQKLMEKHNGDIAAARREIEALGPGDLYDATFKYLSQFAQTYRIGKQQETDAIKQAQEKVFNEVWARAIRGEVKIEEAIKLRENKQFSQSHFNQIETIINHFEEARKKAAKKFNTDRLYDAARDTAREFGLDKQAEGRAHLEELYQGEDLREVKRFYEQYLSEQRAVRTEEERQKTERQKQIFSNLLAQYWRQGKTMDGREITRMEQDQEISREQANTALELNARLAQRTGVVEWLRAQGGADFASMTQAQQEDLIMKHMGITEEQHKETFATLLKMATEGTLTDARVEAEFQGGRINSNDRERLKNFDTQLDRQKKEAIALKARELITKIQQAGIKHGSQMYQTLATTSFYQAVGALDLRSISAEKFGTMLDEIAEVTRQGVLNMYGDTIVKTQGIPFFKKPTPAEERRQAALSSDMSPTTIDTSLLYAPMGSDAPVFVSPNGEITPAPTETVLPPLLQRQIAPAPIEVVPDAFQSANPRDFWSWIKPSSPQTSQDSLPQSSANPHSVPEFMVSGDEVPPPQVPAVPAPQSPDTPAPAPQPAPPQSTPPTTAPTPTGKPLVMGFVKGGTVPNGGGFTASRGYRGGQHNGLDISAPEGTPVKMVDFGTHMSVKKVHTDNPSSGLGDYVELWGQYPNGDIIEVSLGHFQRGTIRVKPRVIIGANVLIGYVGNTGMTSDREKGGVTGWYEGKKSGYHLDIKIKINGKYVDPETFTPPVDSSPSLNALVEQLHPQPPQIPQAPQPQPYSPLVESTDAQRMDRIQELLLFNLFPDIGFGYSGDLNLGRTMF